MLKITPRVIRQFLPRVKPVAEKMTVQELDESIALLEDALDIVRSERGRRTPIQ